MAYLDLPLFQVKSPEMVQILQMIQWALNVLDENNFPNKVSGDAIIAPGSLTGNSLADLSVALKKLKFQEWPFTLTTPEQPATTTTSLDCGGFFVYDPAKFPGGSWYFEAALKISDGSYSATAQLKHGSTVLGSVSTSATSWTVVRTTSPVTMPSSAAALTVTLVSPVTTVTAYLWAARLIYVP